MNERRQASQPMPKKMSKVPLPPEIAERYPAMIETLNNITDALPRVLLVHNFLDRALASVLRATLVKGSRTTALLDPKSGPIGSYGARSQLVHCLGMISNNCKENLDALGDIRNVFAHSPTPLTFDDREIKDRCAKFIPASVPHKDGTFKPSWNPMNFTPDVHFTMASLFHVYEFQELGKTLTHADKCEEPHYNLAWIKGDS